VNRQKIQGPIHKLPFDPSNLAANPRRRNKSKRKDVNVYKEDAKQRLFHTISSLTPTPLKKVLAIQLVMRVPADRKSLFLLAVSKNRPV
jgi:hypothetical protein